MAFDGNPVFWADPSGADGITITIDWNQLANNSATILTPIYDQDVWDSLPDANLGPEGMFSPDDITVNSPCWREYLARAQIKIS